MDVDLDADVAETSVFRRATALLVTVTALSRVGHVATNKKILRQYDLSSQGETSTDRRCAYSLFRLPYVQPTSTAAPRRVYDIVSFLPPGDLEVLRGDWVKGGTCGVTKELFLGNMLRVRSYKADRGNFAAATA